MLIKKWWETYSDFELEVATEIWDEYKPDLVLGGIFSIDMMIEDRGLFKSLIQNFWSTRIND